MLGSFGESRYSARYVDPGGYHRHGEAMSERTGSWTASLIAQTPAPKAMSERTDWWAVRS